MSSLVTVRLGSDLRALLRLMSNSVDSLKQRLAAGESTDRDFIELEGAIDSAFHISRALIAVGEPSRLDRSVVDVNQARRATRKRVGARPRIEYSSRAAPRGCRSTRAGRGRAARVGVLQSCVEQPGRDAERRQLPCSHRIGRSPGWNAVADAALCTRDRHRQALAWVCLATRARAPSIHSS